MINLIGCNGLIIHRVFRRAERGRIHGGQGVVVVKVPKYQVDENSSTLRHPKDCDLSLP